MIELTLIPGEQEDEQVFTVRFVAQPVDEGVSYTIATGDVGIYGGDLGDVFASYHALVQKGLFVSRASLVPFVISSSVDDFISELTTEE